MDGAVHALNKRKTAFLNNIQTVVYNYIVSRGRQCIAVVEKDSNGIIVCTWQCHLDDDLVSFCKVLYRFTRHQKTQRARTRLRIDRPNYRTRARRIQGLLSKRERRHIIGHVDRARRARC